MCLALRHQSIHEQLHAVKEVTAMVVIAASGNDTQVRVIQIQGDLRLISATSQAPTSSSTRYEPRNPRPPVTKTLLCCQWDMMPRPFNNTERVPIGWLMAPSRVDADTLSR